MPFVYEIVFVPFIAVGLCVMAISNLYLYFFVSDTFWEDAADSPDKLLHGVAKSIESVLAQRNIRHFVIILGECGVKKNGSDG